MFTWPGIRPASSKIMWRSAGYCSPRWSSTSPTVSPATFTCVWLPASFRKGVGMYTVTGISSLLVTLRLHCQVSLAGVAKHRHHALVGAQLFRHLEGGDDVRSRRDANQQAFLAAEPARHLDRVLVRDGDDLVVYLAVEDAGHEAGADALDGVHAGAAPLYHPRTRPLHRH